MLDTFKFRVLRGNSILKEENFKRGKVTFGEAYHEIWSWVVQQEKKEEMKIWFFDPVKNKWTDKF